MPEHRSTPRSASILRVSATHRRAAVYRCLERIERHPKALVALFGPIAARAGITVEELVIAEAREIHANAIEAGFSHLEMIEVHARCDAAPLAFATSALPNAPAAISLEAAKRRAGYARRAINRADADLARQIMKRLRADNLAEHAITHMVDVLDQRRRIRREALQRRLDVLLTLRRVRHSAP